VEELGLNDQFWYNQTVFVTGANGFLGGNLVRMLVKAGALPVCLVRDWTPQAELHRTGLADHVRLVRGDLADKSLIERVIAEYQVSTVLHTAENRNDQVALRHPVSTFESNVSGVWNLLEAARRFPHCEQVILGMTHGESPVIPLEPDSPKKIIQADTRPLTASHQCAEIVAQSYAKTLGMKLAVCHFGLLFGPGDLHWSHTVPGMIKHHLKPSPQTLLLDQNLLCPMLSVDDAAYALMKMAEYVNQFEELSGSSFGFALEDVPTGVQLYESIGHLLNSSSPAPIGLGYSAVKVPAFNISKSRKLLKWKPKFTLVDGLTRTCQWYQQILQQRQTDNTTLPFFRMNSVVDPVAKSA
jgi:CDP-glucose 4,6-dehydratase